MQQKCPSCCTWTHEHHRAERPRGINPKGRNLQHLSRESRFKLPEYLGMAEVNALTALRVARLLG